jgi:cytochrome c-type biogenesis protein CcsB
MQFIISNNLLNSNNFHTTLVNASFLLSFLTTIYYWTKTIFFSVRNYKVYGFSSLIVINFLLFIELIIRWLISGHFPLSSLYESLLFLSWTLILVYIFLEKFLQNEILGVIVAPVVLCILGFSSFSLPPELQKIKPLVPALQSNWLIMHVSVMMLSYAALLIGSLFSITYIILYNQPYFHLVKEKDQSDTHDPSHVFNVSRVSETVKSSRLLFLLDNLSYRIIGIGFCFLTLGILSGAVWANETWGTYWSWDPKETWALITWLTFATYLHTRLIYRWEGFKPAQIASFGFLVIWFCYLGVNLLGKGLHTYGFFQ